MRHDFLDRYSRLASPVHALPAWLKALATLTLVMAMAVARPSWWPALVVATALLVAGAWLSRIPAGFLLRRLLLLEPVVVVVATLALWQPDGGMRFALLVARSTLSLAALILFTNTTPFGEVLELLRRCRVPSLLVTVLALMYRYVFVLVDEAARLQRARASRAFSRSAARSWRSVASGAGQLFVRSSERAERVFTAMCARGWRP
ncbi:MAG: cobalt ECF transporter T component CbiQ [Thermoanaerobaculaceae bacterium]|nr:cobalt ECF transporter T component CbiQ [Thermoanaerobaculaceae bacterium]MDI9621280.1 cobalt ECF transporter T component CbiQ [Acidobacteriota bacterium]NLH11899.1 cobalt ECF transporter T component CbiQ [Holophagae bacterium]HPW54188.1 cobalt ECF transporter T component CbiQ [Thermoanaerobaculaceae bacterium]